MVTQAAITDIGNENLLIIHLWIYFVVFSPSCPSNRSWSFTEDRSINSASITLSNLDNRLAMIS